MGTFESRIFVAHAYAGDLFGRTPFAGANRAQPQRQAFQFQWNGRSLAAFLYRIKRGLAILYTVRVSRSQLSRPAGGLEIHLSFRRCNSGGTAGRHERLQLSAASLDQRLRPDL